MKFRSNGKLKTLKIINVPANQPGVFSGVKLEENKRIEIQATGLGSTGGPPPELKKTSDGSQKTDGSQKKVLLLG